MKKLTVLSFTVLFTLLTVSANAGLQNSIYWNFGPTVPSATYASNSFAGLTVSGLSSGNSFGGYAGTVGNTLFTGSSASSAYTTAAGFTASGGTNAGVGASIIAFDTSTNAYFQVSLNLDSLSTVAYSFTNISLGSRATSTGPQLVSLYSSTDGSTYSAVGSGVALGNNSTWTALAFNSLSLNLNPGDSIYLRIYGSGGSGSPGSGTVNWRIDDLAIALTTIEPVPEPSTLALATIGGVACLFALRRKR